MNIYPSSSLGAAERKIDQFLSDSPEYRSEPLVLPLTMLAQNIEYRGIMIREWTDRQSGVTRYDFAFEHLS